MRLEKVLLGFVLHPLELLKLLDVLILRDPLEAFGLEESYVVDWLPRDLGDLLIYLLEPALVNLIELEVLLKDRLFIV